MTSTTSRSESVTGSQSSLKPVVITLSVVFLLVFGGGMFFGSSSEFDNETAGKTILDGYTTGSWIVYSDMALQALGALTIFWALAWKRLAGGTSWLSAAVPFGGAAIAGAFALMGLTEAALYHVVQIGTPASVEALNALAGSTFIPMMLGLITLYLGVGLSSWVTGALPKWLAALSIIVGVITPMGPGGYIGFMLLPIWIVLVSVLVKPKA